MKRLREARARRRYPDRTGSSGPESLSDEEGLTINARLLSPHGEHVAAKYNVRPSPGAFLAQISRGQRQVEEGVPRSAADRRDSDALDRAPRVHHPQSSRVHERRGLPCVHVLSQNFRPSTSGSDKPLIPRTQISSFVSRKRVLVFLVSFPFPPPDCVGQRISRREIIGFLTSLDEGCVAHFGENARGGRSSVTKCSIGEGDRRERSS